MVERVSILFLVDADLVLIFVASDSVIATARSKSLVRLALAAIFAAAKTLFVSSAAA